MAEKEAASSGSVKLAAPPAGSQDVLQDAGLSFTPLDSKEDGVVQPFPRSPKLLRKLAKAGAMSQEQLSRRLTELQAERSKTEAHIQSLKKRTADLSVSPGPAALIQTLKITMLHNASTFPPLKRSTEVMKQQVRERFEGMRAVLRRDEQLVLDSLELDQRQTRARLDQVLKNWEQFLVQVTKSITVTQRALSQNPEEDRKSKAENLSFKKPDASDENIQLNKERFQRLLQTLRTIAKDLKAQLQRKALLLEHPLQFDKVCCALASSPVTSGKRYWEVDVRCCSAWAVGVAYGSLQRKGQNKEAKLGRSRNSWCVELRSGRVSAWHNDCHVACQVIGQAPLGKVGVWVNYEKGQLVFYDAETMCVLQSFSAAVTPVFDRVHHQFTEPLYPAVRFLRPAENQAWPNHLEICNLNTP
ncbi:hypothetical protein LDENG_00222420 [Lucifuga dentata]|nr:hypothetical protein LDENG_00222420 [Lucifuga dentata]